jgi:putative transposase
MGDKGIENINEEVQALVRDGLFSLIIGQIDVVESNSMIEAFWKSMKYAWLFLHPLDTRETVEKLVRFYVSEHNGTVPHSALRGRTPDEVYLGTGEHVLGELTESRKQAREARIATNRAASCRVCPSGLTQESSMLSGGAVAREEVS